MKDKIDIEKLFSEKFDSFSAKPDPSVFQGIQSGLNAAGNTGAAAASTGMSLKAKIAAIVISSLAAGGTIGYFISESNQKSIDTEIMLQQLPSDNQLISEENSENNTVDTNTKNTITIKEGKVYETKKVSDERVKEYLGETESYDPVKKEQSNRSDNDVLTKIEKQNATDVTTQNENNAQKDIAHPNLNEDGGQSTEEKENNSIISPDTYKRPEITLDPSANPAKGHAPLEVEFFAKSKNADIYEWSFGDDRYSEEQNPIHTFNQPGEYTVELTAAQLKGDSITEIETKTFKVSVYPKSEIKEIPNIFSPNGDRVNDYFYIKTEGIERFVIHIQDANGKRVFSSEDPDFRWDGNDFYGNPVSGVCTYQFVAIGKDGSEFKESRTINVER